mmetsp:Transcript_684/g.1074  ORF Transcript_684/g.1074 Transcript_684/m.1074 type:complete len:461 (+) Transcript_684:157-1539(+)
MRACTTSTFLLSPRSIITSSIISILACSPSLAFAFPFASYTCTSLSPSPPTQQKFVTTFTALRVPRTFTFTSRIRSTTNINLVPAPHRHLEVEVEEDENDYQGQGATTASTTTITDDKLQNEYPNDIDYLITDSLSLSSSARPNIFQAISNPRDIIALPLILVGVIISGFNISGTYNSLYIQLESFAIGLGFISVLAYFTQILSGYNISPNIRRGIIDDATVNLYAAVYTGAVSWLALRTSEACPVWLTASIMDLILPIASIGIFVFSLLAPFFTLAGDLFHTGNVHDDSTRRINDGSIAVPVPLYQSMVKFTRSLRWDEGERNEIDPLSTPSTSTPFQFPPELSPTELLRARGLLAIGVLGCIFTPDALSFALGGQEWWGRVTELHPSQKTLESSTSLFALFAVEASMISHRVGKTGAVCYRDIVPAFVVVCSVLAIIPCICAIHWLGNDVSYFSFYRE